MAENFKHALTSQAARMPRRDSPEPPWSQASAETLLRLERHFLAERDHRSIIEHRSRDSRRERSDPDRERTFAAFVVRRTEEILTAGARRKYSRAEGRTVGRSRRRRAANAEDGFSAYPGNGSIELAHAQKAAGHASRSRARGERERDGGSTGLREKARDMAGRGGLLAVGREKMARERSSDWKRMLSAGRSLAIAFDISNDA